MVQVYPNFFGDFQVISLWTAEQLSKQYRVFLLDVPMFIIKQTVTAPLKLLIYDITFLRMINLAMIMA